MMRKKQLTFLIQRTAGWCEAAMEKLYTGL